MSLKRHNFIAWVLLLTAAISWAWGQTFLTENMHGSTIESTQAATEAPAETEYTVFPTETWTVPMDTEPVETSPNTVPETSRIGKALGMILGFAAVLLAAAAVFVFRQKTPVLGPDGIALLAGLIFWIRYNAVTTDYIVFRGSAQNFLMTMAGSLIVFAVLLLIREGWGWIRSKFPLSWCLSHRLSKRCTKPQISLLILVGWLLLSLVGVACFFAENARHYPGFPAPIYCCLAAVVFDLCCLWKYGADLNHLQKQLRNYQEGLPISIQDGSFAETEKNLLEMQAQHEEAVRTAVTSERFKVELISNVSHDLRTPLTSILGYSELLQKETLSPEGQEQLRRLQQKAGYMNDLVEALFELTKVSSGVTASKKDEIDLIRLLEQTIGLFDDQLHTAGLTVRRHYPSESMIVVTDGARMHQVFANLLTNAIKYALPGTRIHLEVTETGENYRVRMVNTASYEMDFQPEEIMQRFARADKARTTKGSGLGLAIAQTYTESVGGSFHIAIDGDQFSAIVALPRS